MILKYKTHTDPEFKVNRKGVLKQMYGPPVTTTTTTVDNNSTAAPSQHQQPRNNSSALDSQHADVEPTPPHASSSSSNSSLPLQAIAPSRPVPLRIPSHPVVVDWHHLHERLVHVKTSWLESAAHVHNPFIAAPRTSTSTATTTTARDGVVADSTTTDSCPPPPPPPVGVASGSLALFAITRLDVSENGISDLPLALFQLSSLKLLNLGKRGRTINKTKKGEKKGKKKAALLILILSIFTYRIDNFKTS